MNPCSATETGGQMNRLPSGMSRSAQASGWIAIVWLLASGSTAIAQSGPAQEHWVASWSTAAVLRPQPGTPAAPAQPQPAQPASQTPQAPAPPPIILNNQTVRQIVHLSTGGMGARVVLANTFGTAPLTIGAANMALRDKDTKIVAASGHALTFGGRSSVTIPAGAVMFSDAARITVPAL